MIKARLTAGRRWLHSVFPIALVAGFLGALGGQAQGVTGGGGSGAGGSGAGGASSGGGGAQAGGGSSAGGGTSASTSPPPPTVNETNTAPVIDLTIQGAPANHLVRVTRLDATGRRSVVHWVAGVPATLVDPSETGVIATAINSFYDAASSRTLVCVDLQKGSVSTWRCGVRVSGQSSFSSTVELPGNPHAFLHDVCVNEGGYPFSILFRRDNALLGTSPNALSGDSSKIFESMVWSSSSGFQLGTQKGASACVALNGKTCSDPCFVGNGTYLSGVCDTTGLAPACTSNDPNVQVYCTGDPAALCVTDTPAP